MYADTSKVAKRRQLGSKGYYYQQNFKVVLSCGLTEMKAQIKWEEDVRILPGFLLYGLFIMCLAFQGMEMRYVYCFVPRPID